jgi:hypothetical protein
VVTGFDAPVSEVGQEDVSGSLQPGIAVGKKSVLVSSNYGLILYEKDGVELARTTLTEFFASVSPEVSPCGGDGPPGPCLLIWNAQAHLDPGSGRFFVLANGAVHNRPDCADQGDCEASFLLAVSRTRAPLGWTAADWHMYSLPVQERVNDPTELFVNGTHVGTTSKLVVLTGTMVDFREDKERWRKIRVLTKRPLLRGARIRDWSDLRLELGGSTPLPAKRHDRSREAFLVSAAGCSITAMSVAAGTGTTSAEITVSLPDAGECQSPVTAPQKGSAPPLEAGFGTLFAPPVYRDGLLWVALAYAPKRGEPSNIRIVALDMAGWPLSVRIDQDFTIRGGKDWRFYPAIAVDSAGRVTLVHALSSRQRFASVGYMFLEFGSSRFRGRRILKRGRASFTASDLAHGTRNRFATQFAAALDPVDDSAWVIGQYPVTPTYSSTWVARIADPESRSSAQER